jgi:hypothetical protein
MRKTEVNKDWDITDSERVRVPTLLINGEYDFEADDVCAPFSIKWWSSLILLVCCTERSGKDIGKP